MILGYHIICTTYGFWLPNDERGSGSNFVRAPHLTKFGPANPVSDPESHASLPFDPQIRRLAREALMYPHVEFDGRQALSVSRGFKHELEAYGGAMHACAILPNHFHAVVSPPAYDVRRFAGRLKGAATRQLLSEGLHPFAGLHDSRGATPCVWGRLPWVVYLYTVEDVHRAVRYVNDNPVKAGLPRQSWSFITPFIGID